METLYGSLLQSSGSVAPVVEFDEEEEFVETFLQLLKSGIVQL